MKASELEKIDQYNCVPIRTTVKPKVLVTGSNGLMGSAIKRVINLNKYDCYFATRNDGDLRKEEDVRALFEKVKPTYLIHTAAKVGGIGLNLAQPAQLFYSNILMNSFVTHYAYKHKVEKYIAFSSICACPIEPPVVREDLLMEGTIYPANMSYGFSKRAQAVMIEAYMKEYGLKNWTSIILGNVFGAQDYYHDEYSHFMPALIRRMYEAKKDGKPFVVWGDGTPLRTCLYSEDAANFIVKLLELDNLPPRLLVSSDEQVSIRQMVGYLVKAAKFTGKVEYDSTKPNGQQMRNNDISLLKSLMPVTFTPLEIAVKKSYEWYENNIERARQ